MPERPTIFYTVFAVDGENQTITLRSGGKIRARSKTYFKARFEFSLPQSGTNAFLKLDHLSATFSPVPFERSRAGAYIVPLEEDSGNYECEIPWEVLTRKGKVYVGVFAGDMLVTNEAEIEVTQAAPTLGADSQPTQSWWSRFSTALAVAVEGLVTRINGKQDTLTAGENITIENNVISASGGAAIEPASALPMGDGTAAVGSSNKYAREDHRHPTDISRASVEALSYKADKVYTITFDEPVQGEYTTSDPLDDFYQAVYEHNTQGKPLYALVNSGASGLPTILLTQFSVTDDRYAFSDVVTEWSDNANRYRRVSYSFTFAIDDDTITDAHLSILELNEADRQASTDAAQDEAIAAKYTKPSGGIPASDLASGVIPTVPSAATAAPSDLAAVAAVGTSTKYARQDHKHKMPSASDVGALASNTTYVSTVNGQSGAVTLTVPSAATATPSDLGTAAAGSSTKYAREDHVHNKPTAADVGAIAAPSSPATGAFLVWDGTAWTAQTLATWQGGNY